MASRLVKTGLRASFTPRVSVVAPRAVVAARGYASKPEETASNIIAAVPTPTSYTKTGGVIFGMAAAAVAISEEYYVFNAESILFFTGIGVVYLITKSAGAPMANYLDGIREKYASILESARGRDVKTVQDRIDSMSELKDVETLTKSLFALSKETAEAEASNFVLKQKNALNAEAKSVLDAWVRHEAQVREAQQSELVETVVGNVLKQLTEKKVQDALIKDALTEIDGLVKAKHI